MDLGTLRRSLRRRPLPGGGLYFLRGSPRRSEIHWAAARDRSSVDTRVIWDRLVSHLSLSATALSGTVPSAAVFAYLSAISLPGMSWWAGTHRTATVLFLEVGACVWRTHAPAGGLSGWTGRHYLGNNKEVFDVEVYAIFRALSIIDQRQESGHRCTAFVDSTSATDRISSDSIGPGQRFAVAAIEACTRVLARDNEVSIRWVPAHHGVLGNEKADEYAKAAAGCEGRGPVSEVPDQYRWETSLSHMTRVATEARSRAAARWMGDRFGDPRRKYRPPLEGTQTQASPRSAKVHC